jgi:hypothetical protein
MGGTTLRQRMADAEPHITPLTKSARVDSASGGGDGGFRMALSRQEHRQAEMLVAWSEMPRSPGHVFYDRLQTELVTAEFYRALGGGGHLPGAPTPPRVRDTASMVRSGQSPGHAAVAQHVLAGSRTGNPVSCRTGCQSREA